MMKKLIYVIEEINSMKILGVFLVAATLAVLTVSPGLCERDSYETMEQCRAACRVKTPVLEVVEDGLALLFDLPLALTSPITCPIVSRVMDDGKDSDSRRYYRSRPRK
jgi:hypothetical protein